MKLFYTNPARTCARIRRMCQKSIERDKQGTGKIANISIKKFVKN